MDLRTWTVRTSIVGAVHLADSTANIVNMIDLFQWLESHYVAREGVDTTIVVITLISFQLEDEFYLFLKLLPLYICLGIFNTYLLKL